MFPAGAVASCLLLSWSVELIGEQGLCQSTEHPHNFQPSCCPTCTSQEAPNDPTHPHVGSKIFLLDAALAPATPNTAHLRFFMSSFRAEDLCCSRERSSSLLFLHLVFVFCIVSFPGLQQQRKVTGGACFVFVELVLTDRSQTLLLTSSSAGGPRLITQQNEELLPGEAFSCFCSCYYQKKCGQQGQGSDCPLCTWCG